MARCLAVLLCMALGASCGTSGGSAALPAPRRVAVLPLGSVGLPADEAQRVRLILRDEVARSVGGPVASDGEVTGAAQGRGACTSGATEPEQQDRCGVEVGGKLGASHALVGAVGALGRTYLVQLRVIDVGRATPVRALEETLFGDLEALRATARSVAGRLFEVSRPRPWYGRWWVWTIVGTVVAAAVTVPTVILARRTSDDGFKDIPLP